MPPTAWEKRNKLLSLKSESGPCLNVQLWDTVPPQKLFWTSFSSLRVPLLMCFCQKGHSLCLHGESYLTQLKYSLQIRTDCCLLPQPGIPFHHRSYSKYPTYYLQVSLPLLGFLCGSSLPGGSDSKIVCLQCWRPRFIPGSARSPGEENGNPVQYSCLKNSMDGGTW